MGIAAILYWRVLLPYTVALILGDEGIQALLTN
jgi:hypothetical protein